MAVAMHAAERTPSTARRGALDTARWGSECHSLKKKKEKEKQNFLAGPARQSLPLLLCFARRRTARVARRRRSTSCHVPAIFGSRATLVLPHTPLSARSPYPLPGPVPAPPQTLALPPSPLAPAELLAAAIRCPR
jgi:hypothetical protein